MYTPHPDTLFQSAEAHYKELLTEAQQEQLAPRTRSSISFSRLLQPVIIQLADALIASGQRLKASF